MKKAVLCFLLAAAMLMCACSASGGGDAPEKITVTTTEPTELSGESKTEAPIEKTTQTSVFLQKNTVVDKPVRDKLTTEIDRRLVGKYINDKNEDAYIEIREDGTFTCSVPFHTGGTEMMDSEKLSLLLFYRDDMVDMAFVSKDDELFLDYGISVNFYTHLPEAEKIYSLDAAIGTYIRQE